MKRPPDFVVGEPENPYLLRWYIIPKNRFFNIYLHKFCRSDDDRALHNHPWAWNLSIIIKGSYIEHMPKNPATFGKPVYKIVTEAKFYPEFGYACAGDSIKYPPEDFETITKIRKAWRPIFRLGIWPHRVELMKFAIMDRKGNYNIKELPVWTIFITGRRVREWGFYCPKGWKHWKKFVSVREGGNATGEGCDE